MTTPATEQPKPIGRAAYVRLQGQAGLAKLFGVVTSETAAYFTFVPERDCYRFRKGVAKRVRKEHVRFLLVEYTKGASDTTGAGVANWQVQSCGLDVWVDSVTPGTSHRQDICRMSSRNTCAKIDADLISASPELIAYATADHLFDEAFVVMERGSAEEAALHTHLVFMGWDKREDVGEFLRKYRDAAMKKASGGAQ